VCEKETKSILT